MIEITSRQFTKVSPEKGRNHDSNFVLLMATIEKVDQENRPHCHIVTCTFHFLKLSHSHCRKCSRHASYFPPTGRYCHSIVWSLELIKGRQ
jgi:hypothetical protein